MLAVDLLRMMLRPCWALILHAHDHVEHLIFFRRERGKSELDCCAFEWQPLEQQIQGSIHARDFVVMEGGDGTCWHFLVPQAVAMGYNTQPVVIAVDCIHTGLTAEVASQLVVVGKEQQRMYFHCH